jgi:hypothetical protein
MEFKNRCYNLPFFNAKMVKSDFLRAYVRKGDSKSPGCLYGMKLIV